MDLKTYMIRLPKNFAFPQAVIQSYLYQITSGIAYCHQRRIFHRNLCPENILITRKGVIKVELRWKIKSFFMCVKKVFSIQIVDDLDFWIWRCTFIRDNP